MAARLPTVGGDDGNWGQILNDFLSQTHNSDGFLKDCIVNNAKLDNATRTSLSRADTAVQTVNGKTGSSITLSGSDIGISADTLDGSTTTGRALMKAIDVTNGRDAIGAAGLVSGLLTVSGASIGAEQVSAQPLGTRIVIPATELQAAGGSVGVTRSNLGGCPVLTFKRSTVRVIDTFDRADNASSAGSTDTGQSWTASGTWGIQSNRLYNPSAVNGNRLTVPLPINDCDVCATIAVLPGAGSISLMHRWTDTSNYVYLTIFATGVLQLGNVIGGTFTGLTTSASSVISGGEKVTLRMLGTTVVALVNDVQVLTATTTVASGTAAGVRNAGDTTGNFRFDNFSVSDDEQASGFISLPAHWATFDTSCLYTTLSTGSGNVIWQYSENSINLSSGISLSLVYYNVVTSTTLASGTVQRAYLGTGRSVPTDKMIAFGITRRNSIILDTYANNVGLLAVELTQNT
jgi:hypothetical protein